MLRGIVDSTPRVRWHPYNMKGDSEPRDAQDQSTYDVKRKLTFLQLPYDIRQVVYRYALSTILSITDSRLSRSPTLEEVSFLASRRGNWNLCLCSHLIYSETLSLRWKNLTITLSKDGTTHKGDDGRHRLGNADQAFRRRIQHIVVTDPECFGMCYGLGNCSSLRTLTVHIDRIDGIILETKLMAPASLHKVHKPHGRKLRIDIEIVEQPPSTAAGMMINSGNSDEVQARWRKEAVARGDKHRFMFLSDLIPNLPLGCRILIQAKVVNATWNVLKELEGFSIRPQGRENWCMAYEEDV